MPIASALFLRRLRIGAAAAMFLAAVTPALAEEAPAVALLAPAPDTEVIGKRPQIRIGLAVPVAGDDPRGGHGGRRRPVDTRRAARL